MKKFVALIFTLIQYNCALNVSSNYERNCGVMSDSSGLIQGGQLSGKNQFPWITNIFTKQNLAYIFAGSGSLISNHYVLCAANSVAYENYLEDSDQLDPKRNYRPLNGKLIRLILGSTNYKGSSNEPDVTIIEVVQKVILHPNLKGTKPRIANLALLKIRRPIAFSDSVKPVCIWSLNDNQMSNHNNMIMYSVGHGIDESGSISFLRKHAIMTIQTDDICKRFYRNFVSDSGFFCARGNGKATACRHDKGLYVKIDGFWYLRAMSSMFKRFQNGTCSLNAPVLYEDLEPYSSWINSIVF